MHPKGAPQTRISIAYKTITKTKTITTTITKTKTNYIKGKTQSFYLHDHQLLHGAFEIYSGMLTLFTAVIWTCDIYIIFIYFFYLKCTFL